MREALLGLVRGFRFEVTFHVSTGAAEDEAEQLEEHELAAETSLTDEQEHVPLGFQPRT